MGIGENTGQNRGENTGYRGALATTGGGGERSWKLDAGHYEGHFDLAAVYPLPDATTNSYARHRNAYPGVEYQIPVGVRGGEKPYRYDVIVGPTGMTIGNTLTFLIDRWVFGADYRVVKWTPVTDGPAEDVTIRVTDQAGSTINLTWTVTPTYTGFLFLDPNVSAGGTGTLTDPLSNVEEVYTNSVGNEIVYVRGGTLVMDNELLFGTAGYPMSWQNHPDETIVMDASNQGQFAHLTATAYDIFCAGFTILDCARYNPNANTRVFMHFQKTYREALWQLNFVTPYRGSVGGDNQRCIVYFHVGDANTREGHNDIFISDCDYDCGGITDLPVQMVGGYGLNNFAFENIHAHNGNVGGVPIFLKGTHVDGCVSYASVLDISGTHVALIETYGATSGTDYTNNVEVCYCKLGYDNLSDKVLYNGRSGTADYMTGIKYYRNSVYGRIANSNYSTGNEVDVYNNVILSDQTSLAGNYLNLYSGNVLYTNTDPAPFDLATMDLIGTARDDHLGTKGAEIA